MGVLATTAGRSQPPGVNRNRFPPAKTLIFAVTREAMQVIDARPVAQRPAAAASGRRGRASLLAARDPAHALRPA